jgi:hypothetical protein
MKRLLLQFLAFIIVLGVHFVYSVWDIARASMRFGSWDDVDFILTYTDTFNQFVGFSLGLGAVFIVYALFKFFQTRDTGRGGVISGVIISSVIFLLMYFFLGCYQESFMFDFYVNRLAYFYVTATKPITLFVTIISTLTGYIWIWRKTKKMQLNNN